MAIIQLSAHMTSAAGKIGGTSFHRTKSGYNIIQQPAKKKKASKYQIQRRNYITVLSQRWKLLTEAQRKSWNAAAQSGRWTSFSTKKPILQGFQLFKSHNYVRYFTGQSLLSAPIAKGANRTILTFFGVFSNATPRYDLFCSYVQGAFIGWVEIRVSYSRRPGVAVKYREVCLMKFNQNVAVVGNNFYTEFIARYGLPGRIGERCKYEFFVYDNNFIEVTDYRTGLITIGG